MHRMHGGNGKVIKRQVIKDLMWHLRESQFYPIDNRIACKPVLKQFGFGTPYTLKT